MRDVLIPLIEMAPFAVILRSANSTEKWPQQRPD